MWSSRRIAAIATLTALLLSAAGGAALAKWSATAEAKAKAEVRFTDMDGYDWGLGDVVRLTAKGVFKGRSETRFAPGAAITRQEMAVAAVRLIDREAEAQALTEAEIDTLLGPMEDQGSISAWARGSIALLVEMGAIDPDEPFRPTDEATRLDVAVLLVNALGYGAEAEANLTAELGFRDAAEISADLVGHVATAVEIGLITGYDNGTFLPDRAVKRIEMAVMMGRADRLLVGLLPDEPADDPADDPGEGHGRITVEGKISLILDAEIGALGASKLIVSSETEGGLVQESFLLPAGAKIFLNGAAASALDLEMGDTVILTIVEGRVQKVEASR